MGFHHRTAHAAILSILLCVPAASVLTQSAVKLAKNNYTPQQDVELGRKAAAEVRQQYPIIESLTIASAADASGFEPVKATFASLPPAKSIGDLGK
jgi:predicted Zn-dependent protease